MQRAINRVLKQMSKKLKLLSDNDLTKMHEKALSDFTNGNKHSKYIIMIVENELKCRGITSYKWL